ncbi:MAG: disulfide bond formation protein B [Hyphomicrobiaceae bacterium]
MSSLRRITEGPGYQAGTFALVAAVAAILGAYFFEYVVKLAPCHLCLQQRLAYYAGIPALFIALVVLAAGQRKAAALLFFAVAVAFLANTGLAVYHAGVEWQFWPGPDTCTQAPGHLQPLGGGSILDKLKETRVIRCDVAAWRFLGLSLAGWNVIASFVIFVACLKAAFGSVAPRDRL